MLKRLTVFLLFVLPGHPGVPRLRAAGAQEVAVGVLEFKTGPGEASMGEAVARTLRAALKETGRYAVLEPGAPPAAGTPGARFLVNGSVVRSGEKYLVTVRFVDSVTGAALVEKKFAAGGEGSIPAICSDMARSFQEEQTALESKEKRLLRETRTGATENMIKGPPAPQHWAVGGIYPGAAVKYVTAGKTAWELRTQAGSGVYAFGGRYYSYFRKFSNPRFFLGLELDHLTFRSDTSRGYGYAAGGFAGGEYQLTRKVGLLMDFGPMLINLKDRKFSQSDAGAEYVVNAGLYWHFR